MTPVIMESIALNNVVVHRNQWWHRRIIMEKCSLGPPHPPPSSNQWLLLLNHRRRQTSFQGAHTWRTSATLEGGSEKKAKIGCISKYICEIKIPMHINFGPPIWLIDLRSIFSISRIANYQKLIVIYHDLQSAIYGSLVRKLNNSHQAAFWFKIFK